MKILWAICVIPLIVGIFMMAYSISEVEYSTDEYWVASDYRHVYDKYSGEIVDYISEGESCEIVDDTITVTTRKAPLYSIGSTLTILFGMGTAGLVFEEIRESDFWDRFR